MSKRQPRSEADEASRSEDAPPTAVLSRCLATDDSFRVVACVNTDVVVEAATRHNLVGLDAMVLGRTLTAAQLLATLTKGDERVTVQVAGDGPVGGAVADAWSSGAARGHLRKTTGEMASKPWAEGRTWLTKHVGRGLVTVLRDLGLKDIYQGVGAMRLGEIDEDVEAYLRVSEQIPSALGCEVRTDDEGRVVESVGVMVQSVPGTREQEGDAVRETQHRLRTGRLYRAVRDGFGDVEALAAHMVEGFPIRALVRTTLRFTCRCDRERVTAALLTLGAGELLDIARTDGVAAATCHFCSRRFEVGESELRALAAQATDGS